MDTGKRTLCLVCKDSICEGTEIWITELEIKFIHLFKKYIYCMCQSTGDNQYMLMNQIDTDPVLWWSWCGEESNNKQAYEEIHM